MSKKKLALLAAKFAFSALLIWYFVTHSDLAAAADDLSRVGPATIILALAILGLLTLLISYRWLCVMHAISAKLPYLQVLRVFMIGLFFNATLVSTVGGDAFRIWLLTRLGLRLGKSVNGIFLDRLIGLLTLLILIAAGLPLIMDWMAGTPARWGFPLIVALGGLGLVPLLLADRLPEALSHLRLVRWLATLAADSRALLLRWQNALPVTALSLIGHVISVTCIYVLARGMDVEISFVACLVLVPPVILAQTLPISIAGWGVREGAMIAAFGLVGVSQESALVVSILYGLCITAIGIPGGIIWLLGRNRTIPAERLSDVQPS